MCLAGQLGVLMPLQSSAVGDGAMGRLLGLRRAGLFEMPGKPCQGLVQQLWVLHVQSKDELTTACQQLQLALVAGSLFKLVPAVYTASGETGTNYDTWLTLTAICKPAKRTPLR